MNKEINEKYIKPIFETNSEFTEWFGYYNYDVISKDGRKLLCNRATFDGRQITAEDKLELGWYDLPSGCWHHIATTDSFNWQQGAMLQWMPNDEDKVIYNISMDNHFCSIIHDIKSDDKKIINFPTYCVTPDGKYSIALNYERSYWCRAYHYQTVKNPEYDVQIALDDGVFKVDLEKNRVERIVDIKDVVALDTQDDFKNAKHWFEHIMINNAGDRIAFLHRFSYGTAYNTRLLICGINGENLQIIDGWKENDWSHFGWKGDREFVIYSVKRNAFQAGYAKSVQKVKSRFSLMSIIDWAVHLPGLRLIKDRLKPNERFYKLYKEVDGKFTFSVNYDNRMFSIDGHPSFTVDGRYMITDSYPDETGKQRLMIFDCQNKKGITVAKLDAPLSGNPASCDLHPKLSFGGKYVAVDTAYTGKHRMIVFEIHWDEVKKILMK
jgi:hypothetical protein